MLATAQERTTAPSARTLRTVQQFCHEYPAFTLGGMRWLLFHREQNGLAQAVIHVGRRVLIDVDRFFEWIDAQNGPEGKKSARGNGQH